MFTAFRDQNEHSRLVSRREIANVVYTETSVPAEGDGPDGLVIAQAADAASQARWRKRAAWLSSGDSGGPSAASAVANATLGLLKDAKQSRTIKVDPTAKHRRPFDDFTVSDWVTVELEQGASDSEARQVMAISVDVDADGYPAVELTLQSRFEARQIKLQKAIDKMGGGGAGSGTSTPIPASDVLKNSKLADLADVDVTGVLEGQVLQYTGGKWVDVTPNLTLLTDVDTAGVAAGNALIYDGATGQWKPGSPAVSVEVQWASILNKPATFPPASHTHTAAEITDSTATGRSVLTAATAAAARTAIGAGTSNLAVGTGAGDAKAGNWVPSWTEVTGKPSSFEPVAKPLDHHTDVDTTSTAPTDGQALVWNAAANLWKPATIAAAGGGGSTGPGWQLIVDQSGASFGSWVGLAGSWASSSGEIVQSSTSGTTRAYYNVRLPAGPLVVDVEVRMDSAGANGADRQVGILLGFAGTNTTGSAFFRLNWDGASAYNVQGESDAVVAKIGSGRTGWRPDEWHRFRILWNGSAGTLWHNGILIGTGLSMSNHGDGSYLGFKTNAAAGRFRNIKVWALGPTPVTTDFPAAGTVRTAIVNYPPNIAGMSTTTATAFRGTWFTCTGTATVKEVRARIVSVASRSYTIGIYELASDRTTITAVTGEVQVTGAGGDQTFTVSVNIPLVAGRAYVIMVGSAAGCTHYYQAVGALTDSPVTSTAYQGGVEPARSMLSGAPAVGTSLASGKGSDYNGLGMTLDY